MKEIGAAKFKEHCLALLDEVDQDGIVITKRGKPVAKLIPFSSDSAGLMGSLSGRSRSRARSSPPGSTGMLNVDTCLAAVA